jgi:hypothetical protein
MHQRHVMSLSITMVGPRHWRYIAPEIVAGYGAFHGMTQNPGCLASCKEPYCQHPARLSKTRPCSFSTRQRRLADLHVISIISCRRGICCPREYAACVAFLFSHAVLIPSAFSSSVISSCDRASNVKGRCCSFTATQATFQRVVFSQDPDRRHHYI